MRRLVRVARHGLCRFQKKVTKHFFWNRPLTGSSGKWYIQSAYKMPDEAKREQETHGLRRIPDSFGKFVIVDGIQPFYTDEHGISYVSLMDFLLKPEIIA